MTNQPPDRDKEYQIILNEPPTQEEIDQRLFNLAEMHGVKYDEIQKEFNVAFEDRLKKKIKQFVKSELSPLERNLKKQQVKNWLKFFFTDQKMIDNVIDYYVSAEEVVIISTIKAALFKEKDRSRYLVDELLLRGALYLVAAAPKTGKSLFATDLAVTCCLGEKFLNRKVKANTNVLFIQNEENLSQTAFRAYNNGLQNLELENPVLFGSITETHRFTLVKNVDIIQDLGTVTELIDKYEAKLVIVDSLSASVKKGGLNEHSPELLAGLLTFQQMIQDKGITGLLIHHTTKADTNTSQSDMVKGIAGRNDISRANDGIIKMEASKEKGIIDLYFLPRNGQQTTFKVKQDVGEACYWKYTVVEEESLSPENIAIQNKILRLLKDRYDQWLEETKGETFPVYGYYMSEIEKLLNLPYDTLVERTNYMLSVEGIERIGHNKRHFYHYPLEGESWLDQYLLDEEEKLQKQKMLLDLDHKRKEKLLSFKTYDEIQNYLKDWTRTDHIRILKLMSEEEKDAFYEIVYKPDYKVGELVSVEIEDTKLETKVLRVTYDLNLKYHKYFVEGIEQPVLISNITKVEK